MAGTNESGKEKKRRPGWVQALDLVLRTWHIGVTSGTGCPSWKSVMPGYVS
jgi:hypothetical protein